MVDYYGIGQRIYQERKRLNMSREKLAEHLGLSVYYIGQLERGTRKMSFDTLIKLSSCLHVSLDYLIYGTDSCDKEKDDALISFIDRCSTKERDMLLDVAKVIMPYMGNN